jgi:hypothetical protein
MSARSLLHALSVKHLPTGMGRVQVGLHDDLDRWRKLNHIDHQGRTYRQREVPLERQVVLGMHTKIDDSVLWESMQLEVPSTVRTSLQLSD